MTQPTVTQRKKFVYLKLGLPGDGWLTYYIFPFEWTDRDAAGRDAAGRDAADRDAADRDAAEKVCVPKIEFAGRRVQSIFAISDDENK